MAEPKHPQRSEREDEMQAVQRPVHQHGQTIEPAHTPAKPLKRRTELLGKKIVATRPSRDGDHGYQLSTIDDQVTVIFEDGGEQVVKSSDLFE